MSNPRDDERRKFEARFGPKPSPHAYCWEFGFQCWLARAEQAETPRAAEEDWWMIRFDESGVEPMVIQGEEIARKVFASKLQGWNCQLFKMVDSGKRTSGLTHSKPAAAPVEDRPAPTPPYPDHECAGCNLGKELMISKPSSIVGKGAIHLPEGWVCMKYVHMTRIKSQLAGAPEKE